MICAVLIVSGRLLKLLGQMLSFRLSSTAVSKNLRKWARADQ